MGARSVTVIPATINPLTHTEANKNVKRRTAAYARVSTDKEEQINSYKAQVSYYTKLIQNNPEWKFVKVYTDEGITGTNIKRRDGFNDMVNDALSGKIDLIITKSVSRFARNTVDSLITIRQLKEKGIEVYFEKENIYTLDSKGELLITLMSSLAQEESRSISENVTWGQRKRFADGKITLPYKQFLGYEKGDDGIPKIVPEQAEIVRRIYSMYMKGMTAGGIARALTADGIPSPSGKKEWACSTVNSILTNEKYRGSALLQKEFTVDFLTKKKKVNEGEVAQYYIENSHEAIINPIEWDAVQVEITRRKALGRRYSGQSVFATKIVCGDCGSFFGRKVWHSNSPNRKIIWRCNEKFNGKKICNTPFVTEEDIKSQFIDIYNEMIENKEIVLDTCRLVQDTLTDCDKLDSEILELQNEMEVVAELTKKAINDNAVKALNQDEFIKKYEGFDNRFTKAQAKYEKLKSERQARNDKADAIGAFMFKLSEFDEVITEFDEWLWIISVDKVIVQPDGTLKFIFKYSDDIVI